MNKTTNQETPEGSSLRLDGVDCGNGHSGQGKLGVEVRPKLELS